MLTLLAIGLVLRVGAGCEAIAAMPIAAATAATHCDGMPAAARKPMKAASVNCAICHALPDATVAKVRTVAQVGIKPAADPIDGLVGMDGAPAPPPPKIA